MFLKGHICRRVAIILLPGITYLDFSGRGLTTCPLNFKPIELPVFLNLLIHVKAGKMLTFLPEALSNQSWLNLLLVMFIREPREMLTGWCLKSEMGHLIRLFILQVPLSYVYILNTSQLNYISFKVALQGRDR